MEKGNGISKNFIHRQILSSKFRSFSLWFLKLSPPRAPPPLLDNLEETAQRFAELERFNYLGCYNSTIQR